MKPIQLDKLSAISARDEGIKTAVDHADAVHEKWSERAFEMFKAWLHGWPTGYKFLIEDFRFSASIRGLPEPPHLRAFGGLAVRARNAGLIKSNGLKPTKNVTSHRANANEWEKL
jgi:hypothetical protein